MWEHMCVLKHVMVNLNQGQVLHFSDVVHFCWYKSLLGYTKLFFSKI